MSIFNQSTMIQLTIDNAKMPIPNPKPHITNLQVRPRVPDVPVVPSVPDVRDVSVVRDVRDVPDVRGVSANARCPEKNKTPRNAKFRVGGPRVSKGSSSSSECETFYHPVRRSGVHPSYSRRGAFGIRNFQKPVSCPEIGLQVKGNR